MDWRELIPNEVRTLKRRVLSGLISSRRRELLCDPYDRIERERLAARLFQIQGAKQPLGTIGRSQLLLQLIEESAPTPQLTAEYFTTLEQLLATKKRRSTSGQILLGLGAGRSGSTTLAGLLATMEDSCSTHENPPLIFWKPENAQVQFHVRRLRLLTEHFSLVADVSHWWLKVLDGILEQFPNCKAIGTIRDVEDCAKSFMRIKGAGWGSSNHWAANGQSIWTRHCWDPTYPTYPIPSFAKTDPDRAKYEMIRRYILEYNNELHLLAARFPDRVMIVPTDALSDPRTQARIFDFAGVQGRECKLNLNVRNVADGENAQFRF